MFICISLFLKNSLINFVKLFLSVKLLFPLNVKGNKRTALSTAVFLDGGCRNISCFPIYDSQKLKPLR